MTDGWIIWVCRVGMKGEYYAFAENGDEHVTTGRFGGKHAKAAAAEAAREMIEAMKQAAVTEQQQAAGRQE